MASVRFDSGTVFYDSKDFEDGIQTQIPISKLRKGMLVRVPGSVGEFKIIDRLMDKGKQYVEAEFIADALFKVSHRGNVFGVEAICAGGAEFPSEYFVTETKMYYDRKTSEYKTKTMGRWIPQLECVRV